MFFPIPYMSIILGLGMISVLILHKMKTVRRISFVIPKPISIWLLFSFYVMLSGFFVAFNKVHLLDSLFKFVQILAMMIYIINISIIEKSNEFFIKTYLLYSIVYMFTMLLWGFNGPGGRLYLSASSNPNSDGLILLFGVFCVLMLFDMRKSNRFILSLGLLGLFTYTIILTGSRKSFIALVFLLALWFILAFKDYWRICPVNRKIQSLLVLIAMPVAVAYRFVPAFFDSTLYRRLVTKGYSLLSDQARSRMYVEALQFFYEKPLFGIGFNHYRLLSVYKTYSHSTYAEIISTTGIIGTIIYFSAYVVIVYNLYKLYRKTKGTIIGLKSLQYIILMITMLALGLGAIHFYGIMDNIMFALMISFYYIEKNKLKQAIHKLI